MKIGKKLREYRYRNNSSQQDIAQLLNISQSTYCDWEVTEHFLNLKIYPKLLNFTILRLMI